MVASNRLLDEARSGIFTVINLSPIDVGYGLLMVSAFGLQFASQGIAAAFMAIVVGNLVPALFGRSGMLLSGARPAQTLLIAELLVHLPTAADRGSSFEALFAYAAVCTVLAGTLQMALGLLRFGNIIKYLPIPVLAGYINAVALLIVWPASLMILGFSRDTSVAAALNQITAQTIGNAVFALLLLALVAWVHAHYRKMHWSIAGLFGGTALYYVIWHGSGMQHIGHLPDVASIAPYWDGILKLMDGHLPAAPAEMVRTVLPYAFAITAINSMESLLASAMHEEYTGIRSDANRVLIDQGLANMVGGMLGSLPLAPSVSRLTVGWELGGRGSPALCIAALTGVLIMIFGARFLGWVPMLIVGVLMLYLAWTMIDSWTRGQVRKAFALRRLEKTLRRQVQTNLAIMLCVIIVAISGHLIAATFAGAMLAMFLFVRDYSRSVIGRTFSGAHRHSVLMRPEHEAAHLERIGSCIHVIELNAPIVFGTADRLLDHLLGLPEHIRYLILDCQGVREIDDKGARIFVRLASITAARGIELHLSYIQPDGPRGSTLQDAGLIRALPLGHWHSDTDLALEAVEEKLIAAAKLPEQSGSDLRHLDIVAGLSDQQVAVLHRHLNSEQFSEGAAVFLRGDSGDRLYIVASGCVEIHLPMEQDIGARRRLASFLPGVIFGEMAMLSGTRRSADAIATIDTTVWSLSADALDDLKRNQPGLASQLALNIARQLSARLAVTNDELVYATRN